MAAKVVTLNQDTAGHVSPENSPFESPKYVSELQNKFTRWQLMYIFPGVMQRTADYWAYSTSVLEETENGLAVMLTAQLSAECTHFGFFSLP